MSPRKQNNSDDGQNKNDSIEEGSKGFEVSSTASASDSSGSPNESSMTNSEKDANGFHHNPTGAGTAAGRVRRRHSTHRQSLARIHSDVTDGRSVRYSVPDPSANAKSEALDPSEMGGSPEGWVEKHRQNFQETLSQRSCLDWTATFIPMTRWLRTYRWKDNLLTDVLAGLTVGVMIVPQSMSYAKLAGLPVEFGLYSSLVPIYSYAMFGSSRQLAVGPVALVSLLLNTGLTLILDGQGRTRENTPNYDAIYATMALQTSVLVGICYIVMGLLRLGFVTIFLSHAVVSGFTSAAAIIIGLSQMKYLLGYDIPSDKSLHRMLYNVAKDLDQFNWKTFLLGSICVMTLLGLKKFAQKYPSLKWTRAAGPLLVTVVTIVLQATVDLEDKGIPVVGAIPSGLPKFAGGEVFPVEDFGDLSVVIFSIVIVGFMESIAIAKQLANKHSYEVDSSLELLGLGMANLTSGLFGGYPVTGSFSRSAVNNESGAQSGISAMVTATLVGLVLLFLTSVFELLPLAVLASIVISGVISLVDYPEALYLWKVHKFDFSVWMCSFIGTLFLGVELGLGIAVGISLLLVLFESAYPHTAVLGRLPGTHQYRNVKQYPDVERYDGIVMVRIDAPIYFANTQNVREKIQKYYQRAEEELSSRHLAGSGTPEDSHGVKYIILELSPVSHVDTSALHILHDMNSSFKKNHGIQLCLANPNPGVMHRLVSSGVADEIGREHIFVSLHDAVSFCLHEMDTLELGKEPTKIDELMHDVEPSAAKNHSHLPNVQSENTIRDFSDDRAQVGLVYDV